MHFSSSMSFSRRSFLRTCSLVSLAGGGALRSVLRAQASFREMATPRDKSIPDAAEMAKRVREEFLHAWNGYKQYAWGHDELRPLSKSYHDWYGVSLCMTPVDSLDTMILLGLEDEASKTKDYIAKNLSFHQDIYVKNFEITIRLLGGLLSSHQLTGDKHLLDLAADLGSRLLPVF